MTAPAPRRYHHGDLKAALVRAGVEVIGEVGPSAMSLREVARRADVTHAAATYHFGDKAGLLTAVAADGYRLLADELGRAQREERSFLEVGVAYVRFALTHRAYFEVMYRPELYRADDPALVAARSQAATILYGTTHANDEQTVAGVAAWSLVHGLATLWLNGNLPAELGADAEDLTRRVARHLRTRRR